MVGTIIFGMVAHKLTTRIVRASFEKLPEEMPLTGIKLSGNATYYKHQDKLAAVEAAHPERNKGFFRRIPLLGSLYNKISPVADPTEQQELAYQKDLAKHDQVSALQKAGLTSAQIDALRTYTGTADGLANLQKDGKVAEPAKVPEGAEAPEGAKSAAELLLTADQVEAVKKAGLTNFDGSLSEKPKSSWTDWGLFAGAFIATKTNVGEGIAKVRDVIGIGEKGAIKFALENHTESPKCENAKCPHIDHNKWALEAHLKNRGHTRTLTLWPIPRLRAQTQNARTQSTRGMPVRITHS